MLCSRVHITEATLYKLDNEYHVEPYLSDPVQTYLIVSNQVKLDIAPLVAKFSPKHPKIP